ncbi:hypothetical protein P692DRAFT_20651604, partial [Suillus brevipes Sb2]
RFPCASSQITPSGHRPLVHASDRRLLWSTPSGQDWQAALEEKYPNSSLFRLFQVIVRSLDTNTRSNYGAGLLRFMQFCDSINIPEAERMPAAEKTLNNWLAGVQFWHVINGAQWCGSQFLHHTRRGFSKMVPPSSRRAKRPPTIDALTILHDHLDLSDPFDAAVSAVAMVSFWSCCRSGELVIPSPNVIDILKHVSRTVLPLAHLTVLEGVRATVFHIP